MRTARSVWLAAAMVALLGGLFAWKVLAQQPNTALPPATPTTSPAPGRPANPPAVIAPTPPPVPTTVAATVNGQPIMEFAVQRGLKRWPVESHPQVRPEIITYLVDKTLVDQYLAQLRVAIDNKDVEAKLKLIHDEIAKQGTSYDKVMKDLYLSEAELRGEIVGQLRWEKFVGDQATDKALRDLFDNNKDMFDHSLVRARHILLAASDAKAAEQARAKLLGLKKQIEDAAAAGLAKLPATTDNLAREKERTRLLDEAFAAAAGKESTCPSHSQGGDLGFFPRAGSMVEPFATVAFRLKPYQLSDPITTQYGLHLIMVIERRAGKEVKYDDVKDEVKEVYGDRLRDDLLSKLRPAAKVAVNSPPKP